jgi:alpha-1,2-mannosyltransferase
MLDELAVRDRAAVHGARRSRFGAPDLRHRREVHVALAGFLVALGAYLFVSFGGHIAGTVWPEHVDLTVYRLGARVLLNRGDLYGVLPQAKPGLELPFTYPPMAAMVLAPLAMLPLALDGLLSTLLTVVLLALVLRVVLRSAELFTGSLLNRSVLIALPVVLVLDPVRVTLVDGQIDVALMALVVWDALGGGVRVGGWRARGVLMGLAAAVKLTPAVFVLYFLAQRDRRSALRAAASFAGFTALGFAMAPGDSAQYWGHTVLATGRIGAVWYAANQSLQAVFTRAGLSGHALSVAWVLGCLVVLALAWTAMRRALAQGDAAGALIVNALAELLISPISWTHHWVWIVPALVVFGAAGRRSALPRARLFMITVFALFALGPQWLLPHSENRELRWALWEQLLGGGYVWFALAILALAALPRHRRPTPTAP